MGGYIDRAERERDGSETHISQTAQLRHQIEPEQGRQNPWREVGVSEHQEESQWTQMSRYWEENPRDSSLETY